MKHHTLNSSENLTLVIYTWDISLSLLTMIHNHTGGLEQKQIKKTNSLVMFKCSRFLETEQ